MTRSAHLFRCRRRFGSRAGVALLEAVVALTVLGMVASSAAWMASELLATTTRAAAADQEMRKAANLLAAVSLWSDADLGRHLGRSAQGSFTLVITPRGRTLYDVALIDRTSNGVLATTTLYRSGARQ
jgi:type II secretory pathway pseudopilin PulG